LNSLLQAPSIAFGGRHHDCRRRKREREGFAGFTLRARDTTPNTAAVDRRIRRGVFTTNLGALILIFGAGSRCSFARGSFVQSALNRMVQQCRRVGGARGLVACRESIAHRSGGAGTAWVGYLGGPVNRYSLGACKGVRL